jgi:hypothetical protein|tara:strand:- start:446 stop:742 length:297 start_codon:yes stop_codon:yes gene_type:complete
MTKKAKKIKQANMQSDNMEMAGWSEGLLHGGDGTVETATVDSLDADISYGYGDLGDMGQLDLFDEMDLRDKYPALNQAWEHYRSVLEVCKLKEKEDAD